MAAFRRRRRTAGHDLARKALRRLDAVLGDEIENLVEIRVGRSGDDQVFRRDRLSPREMMSAFISSAPVDLTTSPR
jgi:hypothetical protein